jgi:excisionase family DNA binding protein
LPSTPNISRNTAKHDFLFDFAIALNTQSTSRSNKKRPFVFFPFALFDLCRRLDSAAKNPLEKNMRKIQTFAQNTNGTTNSAGYAWTINDVANAYSVSRRTVADWQKRKRIPYLKAGKLVRFDPAAVHSALQKFVVNPTKTA